MDAGLDTFVAARDALLRFRGRYAEAVEHFCWPRLDEFNWALDYFDAVAARRADELALRVLHVGGPPEARTFAELRQRSNQVANLLRDNGAKRGDRVLLALGNVAALWETTLAAMKLGLVVVPTTPQLGADELADRLERAEVAHVVAEESQVDKFAALGGSYTRTVVGKAEGWRNYEDAERLAGWFVPDRPTKATDPLLLYFTSGTTSKPKLVQHTHQSYPVGHLSTMYWIGLQPGDVHLNISSPGWAKHAWSCLFAPWNAEASVLVLDQPRFDARLTLEALVEHGVTTFCAPPTVWRLLVQQDLSSYDVRLREAVAAGEPLNPEVIDRVRLAWGVVVRDGFGQTETTALVGNPPGAELRAGSMGRPLPGFRVLLLDEDDQPAKEGEIAVDLRPGPVGVMDGYVGHPALSETGNDFYRTGDVAARDHDGYITYVGRKDDVFKASDYRISPFELESVLVEHPAVVEAAVVPSPDPRRTAVPKAFVVLADGWPPNAETAEAILTFSRQRLAPFKRVRRLEFADLPKTISGKIRRIELRTREADRDQRDRRPLEYWEEDVLSIPVGSN